MRLCSQGESVPKKCLDCFGDSKNFCKKWRMATTCRKSSQRVKYTEDLVDLSYSQEKFILINLKKYNFRDLAKIEKIFPNDRFEASKKSFSKKNFKR